MFMVLVCCGLQTVSPHERGQHVCMCMSALVVMAEATGRAV